MTHWISFKVIRYRTRELVKHGEYGLAIRRFRIWYQSLDSQYAYDAAKDFQRLWGEICEHAYSMSTVASAPMILGIEAKELSSYAEPTDSFFRSQTFDTVKGCSFLAFHMGALISLDVRDLLIIEKELMPEANWLREILEKRSA